MENGLEGRFVIKNNKKLRFGYTTGSCATAAAKAAVHMLLADEIVEKIDLMTPKGILLHLQPVDIKKEADSVSCAIVKESGDDPDVTHGAAVYAEVSLCSRKDAEELQKIFLHEKAEWVDPGETEPIVGITSGIGVGIVTRPGLEQPVGAPAINPGPRQTILSAVREECLAASYFGGVRVCISIPKGVELAEKTFNPRLGIKGGISVLGTSGIVEPMSEQALVASIELEMKQKTCGGQKFLLVTPGNYGTDYLKGNFPFPAGKAVKCSNYVGQTIDLAVNMGLSGMLFVAHIGKFVKVAGGIMNTHSHEADARMEILAAAALRSGADADTARKILSGITTEEGLEILADTPWWEDTCRDLTGHVSAALSRRAGDRMKIGAILFSSVYGELGRTENVEELLTELLNQESTIGS